MVALNGTRILFINGWVLTKGLLSTPILSRSRAPYKDMPKCSIYYYIFCQSYQDTALYGSSMFQCCSLKKSRDVFFYMQSLGYVVKLSGCWLLICFDELPLVYCSQGHRVGTRENDPTEVSQELWTSTGSFDGNNTLLIIEDLGGPGRREQQVLPPSPPNPPNPIPTVSQWGKGLMRLLIFPVSTAVLMRRKKRGV